MRPLSALAFAAPLVLAASYPRAQSEAIRTASIETMAAAAAQNTEALDLQLEVWINGLSTDLIGAFVLGTDGELSVKGSELAELGLATPEGVGPNTLVRLRDLPGVEFHYDARGQRLELTAAVAALAPHVMQARAAPPPPPAISQELGALVNYSLAGGAAGGGGQGWSATGVEGEIEARLFGRFGLFATTALGGTGSAGSYGVRLDSGWTWSDPRTLISYRAGDFISGGFNWTRPVRMGGVQVRREFALRPDLVTMPSPSFSASAVVPSTAEVLVNGATVASAPVAAGPLQVRDLPALQGASQSQLVLRDSLGRETRYAASFFSSPDLLRPGLIDFSAETGVTRRYYGVRSAAYDGHPIASGSVRLGVSDWATLEAHAEGGGGLGLVGAGQVVRIGGLGVVSGAASVSRYDDRFGGQFAVGGQTQLRGIAFGVQAQGTVGRYSDLGSVTAGAALRASGSADPPTRLVQANLAFPLRGLGPWRFSGPQVALAVSAIDSRIAGERELWSTSVHQSLPWRASLFATAFHASTGSNRTGVFVGVTLPIGPGRSASAGLDAAGARPSIYAEAAQQGLREPGSVSWRLRGEAGDGRDGVSGDLAYRATVGQASASASYLNGVGQVQGRLDGAVVLMGGHAVAANRVEDAFALVETGRRGIPVTYQNRDAGRTDAGGRLVVSDLSSFEPATVGVDATALGADLFVRQPTQRVAAGRAAGVRVRFTPEAARVGRLLVLRDPLGRLLPPGSTGRVEGSKTAFVVGYDGQTYLEALPAKAVLKVELNDGRTCRLDVAAGASDVRASACQ